MKKKHYWISGLLLVAVFMAIPIGHLLKTKWNETPNPIATPIGYTNDASQLNLTKIDTMIKVAQGKQAIESQLRGILDYARQNKLKVSIAGARHSMGGHTMYPGGIVVDMRPYNHMKLDTTSNILTIGSGALWKDAIAYLDPFAKSVAVMQAFSSFSIGGSISVNGHGWQKDLPPVSSSVISFTLMNANGTIVNCSRTENPELFRLVIGGYGLFGMILDVKLKVVDNLALQYKYVRLSAENYVSYYQKFVSDNPNVNLVFGRLRISNKRFLQDATLNFFEKANSKPHPLAQYEDQETKRLVFRSTVNSEYGKRLRWDLETGMNKVSKNAVHSRNELLNDPVSLIENKDAHSTDILQEYFIPSENFNSYLKAIKPILQNSGIDLINITIRGVRKDEDSFMNYANRDVFGFVFLFNQHKTGQQESAMKKLTQQLTDVAIDHQGTFYLPYRLHIDKATMRKAYPQADAFFDLKRKYDPEEIFNNKFYQHYR